MCNNRLKRKRLPPETVCSRETITGSSKATVAG